MNYNEAISEIQKLLKDPSSITISKLEKIVKNISVSDKIAPEGAETHLYTKIDITGILCDDYRMIDHTDFAKALLYVVDGDEDPLFNM